MTLRGDQRDMAASRAFSPWFPAALSLVLIIVSGPAQAQQSWMPTVATSPGRTFDGPYPNAVNREPTRIDPQFFPAPTNSPPLIRNPLPQGASSPLVTGALPKGGERNGAPKQDNSLATQDINRALSPINGRPVRAMQGSRIETGAVGAPEKPGAAATEGAEGSAVASEPKRPGPLDALPPNATAAQQYCYNTSESANDARFAWQAKKIKELETQLEQKAQQLEAKTEQYKQWLERRDEFARKAHEKLVGFYARMRPDAAAIQIATLDEEMAAAVMMKLETKAASQIMGEMDPERAAKIATIISGAAKVPQEKKRASPQPASDTPPEAAKSTSPNPAPSAEGPRS